jgi:uncharacterized membrane protein
VRETNRMKRVIPLCVFCAALSLCRVWLSDSYEYLFMTWNLFLALAPFVISYFVVSYEALYPRILVVLCFLTWLLFYPNGPYLITDLVHLRDHRKGPLLWFDLILFFSYAHAGLLLATQSAKHIQQVIARYLRRWIATLLMILLFFAVSFGVYLGRFMRWNSWDLMYRPLDILGDFADCVLNPSENFAAYLVTILFGVMLNIIYFSQGSHQVRDKKE